MARKIEWEGEWIATLIETPEETYLVPPVVHGTDGQVVMGVEVLEAVVSSGVTIEHPVIENCTPERLAELDQQPAADDADLGVPFATY